MFGKGHIFRDDAGRAVRILGALIDVTRRRHLHEQLLQAQKMEAVGQFAGGIAHDFNNVLTVILGHCDLILATAMKPDDLQAAVHEMADAAGRAGALNEQLLTFSRRGKTNPQVLQPNEAIRRMERFARRLAGDNALVLSLAAEVGPIWIDPSQLEQAIMNLVVNARDAMAAPGVITISTGTTTDGQVMVSVSDTGTGMDDATRARIFEPFFTTKEPGKGTGLGLAVVMSVAQTAKGDVRVDTAAGRGTTFELRFPPAA
jgi:signal transduction histidine kinase